jgi:hypothetical protein
MKIKHIRYDAVMVRTVEVDITAEELVRFNKGDVTEERFDELYSKLCTAEPEVRWEFEVIGDEIFEEGSDEREGW